MDPFLNNFSVLLPGANLRLFSTSLRLFSICYLVQTCGCFQFV